MKLTSGSKTPCRELAAAHARHHDVGHEDFDDVGGGAVALERRRAVAGAEHVVTEPRQRVRDEREDGLVVFDDEQGLGATHGAD